MSKPTILVQLDPDAHASVFDAVVAIDAGVDHLLARANVRDDQVRELVHGAIFTRGPQDLKSTAIFIGGTDVTAAERLLEQVQQTFFGPMRVSVMMDASGANTTAAAAVVAAGRHVSLDDATAVVLGATGSVGQRVVRLLAQHGGRVRVASRDIGRAREVCERIGSRRGLQTDSTTATRPVSARLEPIAPTRNELRDALDGASIVIAAGAAGVELLPADVWQTLPSLRVAVDLNAVPPLGIGGIKASDDGTARGATACYGAIGVGGMKMKIHRAAISRLFQNNSQVLDAEEILAIARELRL